MLKINYPLRHRVFKIEEKVLKKIMKKKFS